MNKAPIEKCPYCGSSEGYYTKEQIRGNVYMNFNFDGAEAENGDLYENTTTTGGKIAYCLNCNKRLFKMSELVADHAK